MLLAACAAVSLAWLLPPAGPASLSTTWRRPRGIVRACSADDIESQIAKERAAVEALRQSVSELEESLQTKRESLQAKREPDEASAAAPAPPPLVAAVAPPSPVPIAPASPGGLAPSVFEDFVVELETGEGVSVSEPLRELLLAAWEEGFATQQKEIDGLKRSITAISDLEGRLEGDDVDNLFEELKKTSDIIECLRGT